MDKILVVEDNEQILEAVSQYLRLAEFEVFESSTLKKAGMILKKHSIDLCVLDVMLPDGDGFMFAKKIRTIHKLETPIIFLTAKNQESDRITGFELGGDDYVTKPFSPKELTLRVKAVLSRSQKAAQVEQVETKAGESGKVRKWKLGNAMLSIDEDAHMVLAGTQELELTGAEWKILDYLALHEGIVVSRDQLLENSLDYDFPVSERTIDTHIKNLRQKIGNPKWIETIRSFGYRFKGKKA
ncbi:MAG: response regulator transcription factor [Spirochaetales bacterium]|nr:response regulator transcription factor [Spirochaetales bacterium]